ncbi:MAG: SURF1 family cytochrome oxidase biogenesis protein [Segniliparus sp.]|uniref:SURF1 family cytochrome oxidase biogenesis protein n=1 Tax=Segniliparus sp. TaxID=2804064 RepID=UPI003F2DFEFE
MTTSATRHAPAANRPGWRVFLRPGWIALALAVVLFSVLCFWVFAPWQLGKNGRTEQRNDRISRAFDAPPAPLAELLRSGVGPQSDWRAVTVTGVYESDKQMLLRHRPVHGNAQGPQVLTPLRFDNGRTVLVDRGYLPEGATTAPPAPTGEMAVKARLRLLERTPAGRPAIMLVGGSQQLEAIDAEAASPLVGAPLEPAYLQLDPGQPGALGALEEPDLDPGPYLSYGLQWLAFGVIALIALGYFGYTELRPPTAGQDLAGHNNTEQERAPAAPTGRPSRAERKRRLRAALAGEEPGAREPVASSPLADRYGR